MADLKKLKLIRSQCKATLTRIENYVNDPIILASATVDLLAARKEKLMSALKQYESVQLDILSEDDKDTEDVGQFEDRYFTVLAKINETIKVISKTESFQTTCVSSSKLPTVEIPTFDGKDFTKFKPFHDLFKAVIDNNNSLTDVQKLFYLRKYLLDEALAIIINLPLINKSYKEALQLLEKRYHDPTRLIFGHLDIVLDMPSMQKCTASGLRALISNLNQQLHALKNLEEPVEHWDHIIICVLYKKIDPYTKRAFNLERDINKVPTLKEFINFLEKRAMALEDTVPFKINSKSAMQVANVSSQAQSLCKFCDKKDHAIFKCPKFKMVPIETRLSFVKDNKLCSTCLRAHGDKICNYKFKCKVCKSSHNSLLHSEDKKEEAPVSLLSNDNNASPCNVLLPTIMVKVSDKYGRDIQVRALLDSGSQASFVTNSLVNKLGLTPTLQDTNIIGVGNRATKLNKVVRFCINSCQHENIKFNINCHIVEKITTPLPQQFIDITKLNIPKEIQLSDNNFNIPLEISILLGADIYFNSLLNSCFKILDGPTLQNTVFGYVVAGRVSVCNQTLCYNIVSNMAICDETKLENVMEKFWLSESFPEPVAMVSDEFQRAEASFKQSILLKDNTFHVDLPLVTPKNELQLGDSFSVAWQRFLSLERKLKQNPALFLQYKEFIDLYVAMGHAKEVDINSYDINCGSVYFLAHHAVFNEESKTTKLRTVFDGGMQSKNKISLNDVMLKGPVVQSELFDILLLFRSYLYILICDIEKMFRCVFINPDHRSLQNILWRDDPGKPIACLQLQTVTYGMKASTFLATRCLIELANRYGDRYPLAANAMFKNTYVDDVLSGCDDVEQLSFLRDQLVELLKLGNFRLHKWCSNLPSVLESIPVERRFFDDVDLNNDNVVKTLGLKYDVNLDHFHFQTPHCEDNLNTKRKVLSYIGRIFDPLGLIGPIIVGAKLIMQKIWSAKIEWDTILPHTYLQLWTKFIADLKLMDKISVPRSIQCHDSSIIELVGYADASLKAFGCCLYLRVVKKDGTVNSNILCSKSRVAPLSRKLTIPQLELNSALLLAQLVHRVSKVLTSRFSHAVFLYTDSQIVLAWIASHKIKANTYVNNRVKQIVSLTNKSSWFHVKSADNPADLLSRGVEPQGLRSRALWWHGAPGLADPTYQHGIHVLDNFEEPEILDQEPIPCFAHSVEPVDFEFFNKFSNLNKLQAVIAYIYRFYNNISKKHITKDSALSANELHHALLIIIRCVQKYYFAEEINLLLADKKVKSNIASLSPFIDAFGILRVGGRLQNAGIPLDKMHPAILPKSCHITSLIIEREHLRLLHAGSRLVLSSLSQRFWIISGIREVKKVVHRCLKCIRLKAETAKQLMGSLPTARVTVTRPFQYVGIDFCGPFSMKIARIRKPLVTKGYIALYVCFATKAIHLEVVSDLTTENFLACFNRFISRRGMPTKVFCDNAKTFKGAQNQLNELYKLHNSKTHKESVYKFCKNNYIQFMFIPSYSPQFGGLWEAGVKSVKHHLKRVVGNLCLTYEEFNTVAVQIEGVLNSRPLLSLDPREGTYLTPGHFLIGTALTSYPEVDLTEIPSHRLKFWKLVTKLKQDFWKTWVSDYLTQLQNRPKWKYNVPNLKEDDLVLIKNVNSSPLEWPLARIVKVFPGNDKNVRVAEVKCKNKTFVRSISKLCPLPIV